MVLDRLSFEVVKALELLSCVLGWQWTLNELIINNVWQILKSWADKETNDKPTKDVSEAESASNGEQSEVFETGDSRNSTCRCEEALEICSKCGKLTGSRLQESQIVLCIQLLGRFT